MSDLSPDLIIRLLDSRRKDYILYRVVERIIENCEFKTFLERTRKVDLRDTLGLFTRWDSRYSAHALLLPANGNGDDFFQNRHSEKKMMNGWHTIRLIICSCSHIHPAKNGRSWRRSVMDNGFCYCG